MASTETFAKFIADQMRSAGTIRYAKMFGEYGIYCDEKLVALVCDEKLYVKPTHSGREYLGQVTEASPYPGAKAYFLISDLIEDPASLSELIRLTSKEVPRKKKK